VGSALQNAHLAHLVYLAVLFVFSYLKEKTISKVEKEQRGWEVEKTR